MLSISASEPLCIIHVWVCSVFSGNKPAIVNDMVLFTYLFIIYDMVLFV